jgi:hypothetical protein
LDHLARANAQLLGEPAPQLLVPCERVGRAAAGGKHGDQPRVGRFVQWFTADEVLDPVDGDLGPARGRRRVGQRQARLSDLVADPAQQRIVEVQPVQAGQDRPAVQTGRRSQQVTPPVGLTGQAGSGHQVAEGRQVDRRRIEE